MTATLSESHDAPNGLPGRLDHLIAGAWSPSADGIERRGQHIAELETFDTGLPVTQARGQAE